MGNAAEVIKEHIEEVVSTILTATVDNVTKVIRDAGMIDHDRDVSMAVAIDVHKLPIAGTTLSGNPARMAKHLILMLTNIVKEDPDFDNLTDLLGIEEYTLHSDTLQMYVDFAAQMNEAANTIVRRGVEQKTATNH